MMRLLMQLVSQKHPKAEMIKEISQKGFDLTLPTGEQESGASMRPT